MGCRTGILVVSPATDRPESRSVAGKILLLIGAGLVFLVLLGLGGWQVARLQWKLDLIARVDARVNATAVEAPVAQDWSSVSVTSDAYRHVRVTGQFVYGRSVRVQAVTERGSGFWLLTPLRRSNGDVVLVNRGYVPARAGDWLPKTGLAADTAPRLGAVTTVTGLLRISEKGGAFLRRNDPAAHRWYSRDVGAIAAAGGLVDAVGPVAPYFIDADAASSGRLADDPDSEQPVGGLTVISFHNSHLVYAITWFTLALMLGAAVLWNLRDERRAQRAGSLVATPAANDLDSTT